MNFYKRHIGDYIKDAGHLSLLEHGVYARLMDVYYTRESGIPEDKAARLIGARGKDELQALQNVLTEFFTLEDGLWIQGRCEIEIGVASGKAEQNRANGKKGGRPRKTEPTENPNGFDSGNHLGFKNNLSQTPEARYQIPDLKPKANTGSGNLQVVGAGEAPPVLCSPAEISKVMRECGVQAQPADPRVIALSQQGVSLDTVRSASIESVEAKPGERVGAGYVSKKIEGWAKDASSLNARGAQRPGKTTTKDSSRAAAAASIGLGARHDATLIIDADQ